MTESEIEKWEKEAQKGILRNDRNLIKIVDNLRSTIYKVVDDAGLAGYDVGITTTSLTRAKSTDTSFNLKNSGTLELDVDKLTAALEANADAVRELFTNEEDGIAVKMDEYIDAAVRTGSTNQGTLVHLAGYTVLTGKNTSILGDKITRIDEYISTLKDRLEREYTRYWRKFSALETALSRMSTQAGWLNDFSAQQQ